MSKHTSPLNLSKEVDTLFYDANCPLCSKEIAFLKQHSQPNKLHFVDIHQLDHNHADEALPSKTTMLRILHLRKHDASWITGVDATVQAWSHLPFGSIMKILRWPLIKSIVDKVYLKWAERRYSKRYQCGPCMGAEE